MSFYPLSFSVPSEPPRPLPHKQYVQPTRVDLLGIVGEFGFIRDEVELGLVALRRFGVEGEPRVVGEQVVFDVVETGVLALDGVVLFQPPCMGTYDNKF